MYLSNRPTNSFFFEDTQSLTTVLAAVYVKPSVSERRLTAFQCTTPLGKAEGEPSKGSQRLAQKSQASAAIPQLDRLSTPRSPTAYLGTCLHESAHLFASERDPF